MRILTEHQKKALDYKQHISLTANAGSGKTFVLSKRYLEIALNENISLRNIAAITFTDKAAGELYKKIASEIEEKLKITSAKNEIKKLEEIRRQLVSANISTIHSFCIDILREYPVEAEIDANFSPVDETLSNELIELSVDEMIKQSLQNDEESNSLKYLIRFFASKNKFAQELISLIKNRRNVLQISENIYKKNEEEIAEFFYCSFLKSLNEIISENREEVIKNLVVINNYALKRDNKNLIAAEVSGIIKELDKEQDSLKYFQLLQFLYKKIFTTQKQLFAKYISKSYHDDIEKEITFVRNYILDLSKISIDSNHQEIEKELAKFGKKIIYFFEKSLGKYEEKKKENGFLDFEDILLLTLKILRLENVRDSLSKKFKYIMVDEYQDTNELQYQIFMPILDNLKQGNLFIVGDEKQSIYMFRDSELEVFDKTKRDISTAETKGALLTLPDSFRMAPELCLFANKLFSNLFSNPNIIYNEVGYSELVCAREEGQKGLVEILLANPDEENKEHDTEAGLVAGRILKLIDEENLSWKDIAILCRKRKYFSNLEKIFTEKNIPFSIVGGKGFYQRQAIYDIYNYFSFLLDKNNDTALIGILRSPFFSLSDSEIFELSFAPGKTYWQKLISSGSSKEKLKKIVNILSENLELVKAYNISTLLRKILKETGFLAILSSRINAQQELANIDKLVKITIDFHAQGFKTLYDYVNFLKDSIEKTEDESQAALTDESNSVKIMTLHQAKGLEFPAVFLFKSGEPFQKDLLKSKSVVVNKNLGLLAKVPLRENYFSSYESAPVIGINDLVTEKKNYAEEKRLFYVGVTRAINYLFISSLQKRNYKDSFIEMLIDGLKPDLDSSSFSLEYPVKFLRKKDEKYFNEVKDYKIDVPIIRELEANLFNRAEGGEKTKKLIKIQGVKDHTKNEIISATKAAVYHQCPLKYKMTYEYGFVNLFNEYKLWRFENSRREKLYEFGIREEADEESEITETAIYKPELKGKIIHEILQKEVASEKLDEYLKTNYAENPLNSEIIKDLINYFSSSVFKEIKSYNNYKNEFEVYLKEADYYLYGIIDKLIIEKNKAIIVDYKTDDIQHEELNERGESYLPQLEFYAYIISRLFPDISEILLKIIFIKHPDHPFIKSISLVEINSVKLEIDKMVYNIRKRDFPKNLNHCSKCNFASVTGNCIMK